MTTQQLLWFTAGYLFEFVVVAYFTRAKSRRVLGALAGGVVAGLTLIPVIALGNTIGWWQVPLTFTPGFLIMFYIATAISCSPIYLVTWRVARRFGWQGLAVCLIAVAVIGPPRDYLIASMYPEWMIFGQGVSPILADAATYAGFVALGHALMKFVAGPARDDQLARRPGKTV
jgi:fucose 4-O-acetylase-like acetyltransferase